MNKCVRPWRRRSAPRCRRRSARPGSRGCVTRHSPPTEEPPARAPATGPPLVRGTAQLSLPCAGTCLDRSAGLSPVSPADPSLNRSAGQQTDTTYQSYMSYILVKIVIYSHLWTNHTSHIISYYIKLFEGAFHVSSAAMFPGRSVTQSPDRSVVYNDKKGVNEGIHQTVKT